MTPYLDLRLNTNVQNNSLINNFAGFECELNFPQTHVALCIVFAKCHKVLSATPEIISDPFVLQDQLSRATD